MSLELNFVDPEQLLENRQPLGSILSLPPVRIRGKISSRMKLACSAGSGSNGKECWSRWKHGLDVSIDRMNGRNDRANGRKSSWTAVQDSKLKDALQTHGGENWNAIAALVPGRTRNESSNRWHNALNPSFDPTAGREGKWTEGDIKLMDAVQRHGGNNWIEIAALAPGRTKHQCWDRWKKYMDPYRSTAREGEHDTLNKLPALGQDRSFS
jgi:hypothetical protein